LIRNNAIWPIGIFAGPINRSLRSSISAKQPPNDTNAQGREKRKGLLATNLGQQLEQDAGIFPNLPPRFGLRAKSIAHKKTGSNRAG